MKLSMMCCRKLVYVLVLLFLKLLVCQYLHKTSNVVTFCNSPLKCNTEATRCRRAQWLLQGTFEDVLEAQMMYCGHIAPENVLDKHSRYGYSHLDNLTGPPLVCCNEHYVHKLGKRMCSESCNALRVEFCGRTPVFYINEYVKKYNLKQIHKKNTDKSNMRICQDNNRRKRHPKEDQENNDTLQTRIETKTENSDCTKHNLKHESDTQQQQNYKEMDKARETRNVRMKSNKQVPAVNDDGKRLSRWDEHQNQMKHSSSHRTQHRAANRKKRLAGGQFARIGQFPYLAVIYYYEDIKDDAREFYACLGTLIHAAVILTTFNCLLKGYPSSVSVGQHDVSNNTFIRQSYQDINGVLFWNGKGAQRKSIEVAQVPPLAKYTANLNTTLIHPYDLAVVKVEGEFSLNDFVQPVCLPVPEAPSEVKVGDYYDWRGEVIAIGLGFYASEFIQVPKFYKTEIEKNTRCAIAYRHYYRTTVDLYRDAGKRGYICAKRRSGEGTCAIDEGAPLLRLSKSQYQYQIGVAIQEDPEQCGVSRSAIYIDITQHYKWISKAVISVIETGSHNFDEKDQYACLTKGERLAFE